MTDIECLVVESKMKDYTHSLALVIDPRVPDEWLNDSFCVTGHGWGTREMCEAMHEYVGKDITNEVCGCEEPTERPIISMMYDGNNNI